MTRPLGMEHWNGLIRTTAGMEERMKGWPGEPEMEYDVLVADGDAARNAEIGRAHV